MLPSFAVADLYACPFCRQLFARGEVEVCPECEVKVQRRADLPPSYDAQILEPEDEVPPEDTTLPWTYADRGRGPLVLLAICGMAVFVFAPWLRESAPEIRTLSGFGFARLLPWLWAAGVAWVVMIALVISRRTIRQMRGARVAVAFLAAMVLSSVVVLSLASPKPHRFVPVRVEWGWGLYAAGFLASLAIWYGLRFGGRLDDMPSQEARPRDETLH